MTSIPSGSRPSGAGGPSIRLRAALLLLAFLVFVGVRAAWCWLQPGELYISEEYIQLRLAAAVWGEEDAWDGYLSAPPFAELDPSRPFDLFDFQYHPHEGGTLVLSLLLVPIAGITGLGELPVKVASVLMGLLTALAWVLLLRRLHGGSATPLAAWTFACAPVSMVLATCVLHSYHHVQAALFLPLCLLALASTQEGGPFRSAAWALAAGAVAGLGVWFSALNLAPALLVAVGIPLCLRRRLVLLPCFAAGMCAGLLPWLGANDIRDILDFGAAQQPARDLPLALWNANHETWRLIRWSLVHRPALVALVDTDLTRPPLFPPPLDLSTRVLAAVGAVLAVAGGIRAWRRGRPEGRLQVLSAATALGTVLAILVTLASGGLADPVQRRVSAAIPPLIALLPMGVFALPRGTPRRTASLLLAALLAGHLGTTAGIVAVDHRPVPRLNPWRIHALPTPDVRDRWQVAIGTIQAREAPYLDQAMRALLPSSNTGGRTEMAGIGRAFQYGREACSGEPSPQLGFSGPREAEAFGAGLSAVCLGRADVARRGCDATFEEPVLVDACRAGADETARRR